MLKTILENQRVILEALRDGTDTIWITSEIDKRVEITSERLSKSHQHKATGWRKFKDEKPIAYQRGDWDGDRSDYVLTCCKSGLYHIARMYEGFMDGSGFCDFYDERDYEVEDVEYWMEIPELF